MVAPAATPAGEKPGIQIAGGWDEVSVYALAGLEAEFHVIVGKDTRRPPWRASLRPVPGNVRFTDVPLHASKAIVFLRPGADGFGTTADTYCARVEEACAACSCVIYCLCEAASGADLGLIPQIKDWLPAEGIVCESLAARDAWGCSEAEVIAPGLDPLEYPPADPAENTGILAVESPDISRPSLSASDVSVLCLDGSGRMEAPLPFGAAEFPDCHAFARACRRHYVSHFTRHGIFCTSGTDRVQVLALREAMLCGLAAVAVECPETRALVTHEENGLLAKDADDMPSLIEELRTNADLRTALGRAARGHALRTFHINHCLNAWERVLQGA